MHVEICFLNRQRRLACMLNAAFHSLEHAAHYAREVMHSADCRDFVAAELYAPEMGGMLVSRADFSGRFSVILGGKALAC